MRRSFVAFAVLMGLAALLFFGSFPFGALAGAKSSLASAKGQLAQLQAQNSALSRKVSSLEDPTDVGQLAHQYYGLVPRGDQAYAVLPGGSDTGPSATVTTIVPETTTTIPPTTVPSPARPRSGARRSTSTTTTTIPPTTIPTTTIPTTTAPGSAARSTTTSRAGG